MAGRETSGTTKPYSGLRFRKSTGLEDRDLVRRKVLFHRRIDFGRCKRRHLSIQSVLPRERSIDEKKAKQRFGDGRVGSTGST